MHYYWDWFRRTGGSASKYTHTHTKESLAAISEERLHPHQPHPGERFTGRPMCGCTKCVAPSVQRLNYDRSEYWRTGFLFINRDFQTFQRALEPGFSPSIVEGI